MIIKIQSNNHIHIVIIMVLQILAAVGLPILMMLVVSSPFEEPIKVEPSDGTDTNLVDNAYFAFFAIWIIWILVLVRIVIQVRRGSFRVRTRL